MSGGFVKLYGSILTSSVWAENKETRLVWITMLALADKDGRVDASIPGLAHTARVTVAECMAALDTFKEPDVFSRTKDNDGRRIEEIDGGWIVLNHEKYRDIRSESQVKTAERQKRFRDRHTGQDEPQAEALRVTGVTGCNAPDADAEAEAYTDATTTTTTTSDDVEETLEAVAAIFPKPGAARAMLRGMMQGLGTTGMKAVGVDVLYEAGIELGASEGDVTPHRFKTFVDKIIQRRARVIAENPRSRNDGPRRGGKTLAASKLIQKVRASRNPQFPGSVLPGWRDNLTEVEADVAGSFGLPRILNDQNEGTLVAQLAKALEEAA